MINKKSFKDQSGYAPALSLEKFLSRKITGFIIGSLAIICVLFMALAVFTLQSAFLVWAQIFLSIFLVTTIYWFFINYLQSERLVSLTHLKASLTRGELGRNLTFSAARLLDRASIDDSLSLLSFFEFLFKDDGYIWVLRRLAVDPAAFAKKVRERYTARTILPLAEVLDLAWKKAFISNHLELTIADIIIAVFETDEIFRQIMFEYTIDESDLYSVVYWQRFRQQAIEKQGKFWHKENLLNTKGIGKDWEGGFTIHLDEIAQDLTEVVQIRKVPPHLFGRESEVELLERMLVRGKGGGNVVLVGPPGVGRHSVLQSFAARVNLGKALPPLRYMRILEIDSSAILSGTVNLNQVVDKIRLLFGEAYSAGNVILVVDDIDAFFDVRPEAGRVNATEAILPFLQSKLRIIGTSTLPGYQATVGKNQQLERLIGKLEINELTPQHTLFILQGTVERIEKRSNLFFAHVALKEIVSLSGKLIQNLPNPEKSLEILEDTAVYVQTKTSDRMVLPKHVQEVVSLRTKVPVQKASGVEKDVLLNLESILHKRIIGQDEAIRGLSDAMRRARSGVRSEKKPIGTFLFLGPTGVGKTETTKALAAIYFGDEKRIIRFDMSEFQEVHSINRLIGDQASSEGGLLTEAVIANPFSLILLDELEKAHPKVMDLFLQVFDEGRLTDHAGRTVSFVNTIIIATSNAGAEHIREITKAGGNFAESKTALLDFLQKQGIFRPEFLNRFDEVIVFRPLSERELSQVAVLLLHELNDRLAEKDVAINITADLAMAVARGGYSPEFGARPLRRFIQEHIENYVARGLLSGTIQRGQVVEIGAEMLSQG